MKIKFSGVDGKMTLTDDSVVVKKGKTETAFMLSQIKGIDECPAGSMLKKERGHLSILTEKYEPFQTAYKGKDDPRLTAENTVTFWSAYNNQAQAFKSQIELALKTVARFECQNGAIFLLKDRVIIRKAMGAGSETGNDELQFMLSQIDGIDYSFPQHGQGHLAILSAGYRPYQSPEQGQEDPRPKAKNTVVFYANENRGAEEVKAKIEAALQNAHVGTVPEQTSASASTGITAADEIAKFKNLLDSGAITQDEYDAKKKQLLGI